MKAHEFETVTRLAGKLSRHDHRRPLRPRGQPRWLLCVLLPCYGSVLRCGRTVRAKLLPLRTSQLIDQVIAPRMSGYVCGGRKLPQLVARARQSRASFTSDGATTPPPAAPGPAGSPSATWSGRSPFSSWMQASAVMKLTVPWLY